MSTVGSVLRGLKEEINQFVIKEIEAIESYTCPTIDAANDLGIAIDNAQNAWDYSGVLVLVSEKVDKVVAEQLKALRTFVDSLKTKQPLDQNSWQSSISQFIQSLPLASWQPKLIGLSKRYVYVYHNSFSISLLGMFKYAVQNQAIYDYRYNLEVPEAKVEHSGRDETSLGFSVKTKQLQLEPKKCQFISATLDVQYDAGNRLWPYIKHAIYNVWIGIYPISPGKITLTRTVSKMIKTETQEYRSPTITLSRKDFPNGARKKVIIGPTSGWKIATQPLIVYNNDNAVGVYVVEGCVPVTLELRITEDQVSAYVTFHEKRDTFEDQKETEELQLAWGGWHTFGAKTFHVAFDSFDGKHFEFNDLNETNPYLKLKRQREGYCILALPS